MKSLPAALFLIATAAQADVIYNWEGTCTFNCTGTAHSTLTLREYDPGTPLSLEFPRVPAQTNALISWHYQDSNENFTLFGRTIGVGVGSLPLTTGPGFLDLCFNSCVDVGFETGMDGTWLMYVDDVQTRGTAGTWTLQTVQVAEPSSLSLALFGFLGFCGIWMREQRRIRVR